MTDFFYVGSIVPLIFYTRNADGDLENATAATLTIVKPDGTNLTPAPTLVNADAGTYEYDYVPSVTGWSQATFVATGTNGGAAERNFYVAAAGGGRVVLADVKTYLGTDHSWTDPQIQSALDAERAAQAKVCRVDDFGLDLREALYRRVARNLAARAVPIAQYTSFEGGSTASRVPTKDPEIARLEGPYRKLVVG